MPRGGARPNTGGARAGAGRPPGSGWKPTVAEWRESAAQSAASIVGSDKDPLMFLIDRVFDDAVDLQTRIGCATTAAKYLHPTLSATSVNAQHVVIRADSAELLGRLTDRIEKLTGPPVTIDAEQAEEPDGSANLPSNQPADQPPEAAE